ncbi:hypothetical protein [Agrobacterium pusense]|uniref:hypothetical protein n=1 Tax=Agrobacterium pusense TaxID=648995 RepID=UPI001F28B083|nr:hypothetical protein [Agrobacterium pusense]
MPYSASAAPDGVSLPLTLNPEHPRFSVTYIFYSLPDEAWRIPALKTALVAQQDNIQRPDEGIDRIIGLLLGYSKEEIDQWVRKGLDSATSSNHNL